MTRNAFCPVVVNNDFDKPKSTQAAKNKSALHQNIRALSIVNDGGGSHSMIPLEDNNGVVGWMDMDYSSDGTHTQAYFKDPARTVPWTPALPVKPAGAKSQTHELRAVEDANGVVGWMHTEVIDGVHNSNYTKDPKGLAAWTPALPVKPFGGVKGQSHEIIAVRDNLGVPGWLHTDYDNDGTHTSVYYSDPKLTTAWTPTLPVIPYGEAGKTSTTPTPVLDAGKNLFWFSRRVDERGVITEGYSTAPDGALTATPVQPVTPYGKIDRDEYFTTPVAVKDAAGDKFWYVRSIATDGTVTDGYSTTPAPPYTATPVQPVTPVTPDIKPSAFDITRDEVTAAGNIPAGAYGISIFNVSKNDALVQGKPLRAGAVAIFGGSGEATNTINQIDYDPQGGKLAIQIQKKV